MEENHIYIILGSVLGALVLALGAVLLMFCRKRSKRRTRIFSLRAVTPLDDAEFESWRRPSKYTQRPEKYGILPSKPAVVRAKSTPNIFEKEVAYDMPGTPPRTPPHSITPTSPIRMPDHARRKSSVTSLQDRPPTPFSPTLSEADEESSSYLPHPKSSRQHQGHVHYPSVSEASTFDFGFHTSPRESERFSGQSERRIYTRARQHSET
ncbi:uncharacterized protein BDZ99DRAFT_397187 [Mytilinidion resinicola]|uniref:Uncharacterized protein n=1 Tax=Mytilinidion resinicola TaxID=574789 RepID=A0A6A6Y7K3_9PEZI|nr:uncharacterized protein BDZ99DRAFT_397187 [Mytilinidion resinicola]KAF2804821.1 hypothetical protein BDZ99DRAFT_397187 [Mytilinidion resinicola]